MGVSQKFLYSYFVHGSCTAAPTPPRLHKFLSIWPPVLIAISCVSEYVQFPSLVEPVQSAAASVTLQWRYDEDDPALPAFVIGYLVTVRELGSVSLPGQVVGREDMLIIHEF